MKKSFTVIFKSNMESWHPISKGITLNKFQNLAPLNPLLDIKNPKRGLNFRGFKGV